MVQVGGELCLDVWLAVESDDGHKVRNSTDHGIEKRTEPAVAIQAAAARTARLHDDHQCQRLTVSVFFQRDFLLDAVISKDEIIGSEAENRFAAAGLYQRRHQDEIGAAAQDGGGIGNICACVQGPQRISKARGTTAGGTSSARSAWRRYAASEMGEDAEYRDRG